MTHTISDEATDPKFLRFSKGYRAGVAAVQAAMDRAQTDPRAAGLSEHAIGVELARFAAVALAKNGLGDINGDEKAGYCAGILEVLCSLAWRGYLWGIPQSGGVGRH